MDHVCDERFSLGFPRFADPSVTLHPATLLRRRARSGRHCAGPVADIGSVEESGAFPRVQASCRLARSLREWQSLVQAAPISVPQEMMHSFGSIQYLAEQFRIRCPEENTRFE